MVSFHATNPLRRSRKALSATEGFWHSPIPADDSNASGGDEHASSSMTDVSLPPAHHQLLSPERTSFEDLKGYDHTQSSEDSYDSLDGYGVDDGYSSRKLSAVKREGGGSWLLGFARLNEKPSTDDDEDDVAPGLVRDDASLSDSEDSSSDSDEDESVTSPSKPKRKSISFATTVTVQPIPHSSLLSCAQRRKMYSTSMEVRQNKIRNKREYRYDGYDWRNATEEWEMGVDMVTGELVHPAHEA